MMKKPLLQQSKKIPQGPGVYLFKDQNERILYIGKAKNLKKRVKSHFQKNKSWFWNFVPEIKDVEIFIAQNEKQAMLLETELIKKFKPKYNIQWRDDKGHFYVVFSKEKFPRISLTHQAKKYSKKNQYIGPFVYGSELKKLLRALRIILPYRTCKTLPKKSCLYYHLHLCPAPCINKRQKTKYHKIIQALETILEIYLEKSKRIEGYDISNISGTLATGSMVVFQAGKAKKSEYRKFKIKKVKGQNDVKSLREVLLRRLKHQEWRRPDLILIDGGKGQLKAANKIDIPALALAKTKPTSGRLFSPYAKNSLLIDELPENVKNLFLQIRDEAHRFAISYHKLRRKKDYEI